MPVKKIKEKKFRSYQVKVMSILKIEGGIEDILITLKNELHVIRLIESKKNIFINF